LPEFPGELIHPFQAPFHSIENDELGLDVQPFALEEQNDGNNQIEQNDVLIINQEGPN